GREIAGAGRASLPARRRAEPHLEADLLRDPRDEGLDPLRVGIVAPTTVVGANLDPLAVGAGHARRRGGGAQRVVFEDSAEAGAEGGEQVLDARQLVGTQPCEDEAADLDAPMSFVDERPVVEDRELVRRLADGAPGGDARDVDEGRLPDEA